jgi:hypothetical protein
MESQENITFVFEKDGNGSVCAAIAFSDAGNFAL